MLAVGVLSLLLVWTTHVAVLRVRRRPRPPERSLPISVLKPLKGDDGELFENLASFARQGYPEFELVLGCEDAGDPALAVAYRLKREFPELAITLVAGGRSIGLNPKVNNRRRRTARALGAKYRMRLCRPLIEAQTRLMSASVTTQ